MKTDIHPQYNQKTTITCACGNSFSVGSTAENIQVEICSACHPFYTGKQNIIDTTGQVERFKTRAAKQDSLAKDRKGKATKRQVRATKRAQKAAKDQEAELKAQIEKNDKK